jgi:hypothetical protein
MQFSFTENEIIFKNISRVDIEILYKEIIISFDIDLTDLKEKDWHS